MCKYSYINFDGECIEVEIAKEIHAFLVGDEKRVSREERQARRYCKHFSLYSWNSFALLSVPSSENEYISFLDETEAKRLIDIRLEKIYAVLDTCTLKQRKRFLLYVVEGLSYREIAELEGVSHVSIGYSVRQTLVKIKTVLADC